MNVQTRESSSEPMTERELCAFFRITRMTAHRLRKKGELPFFQLGGQVYYLKDEVLACLRRPKEQNQLLKLRPNKSNSQNEMGHSDVEASR